MNRCTGLDRGFTLIEIIVVIVIISTLILFAAPNFIDQVSYANESHISTDTMILENSIENYLMHFGEEGLLEFNDALDKSRAYDRMSINQLIEKGEVFDSNGLITMEKVLMDMNDNRFFNDDDYYVISKKFLKSLGNKSMLKGEFLAQKLSEADSGFIINEDSLSDNSMVFNNVRMRIIYLNETL